jgi:hypothetical protein
MKSTCGDWKKLDNYTLLGNRAIVELEKEMSTVLVSLNDDVADGVGEFTGYGFFLSAGNECKDYIQKIPRGTKVRLIGLDLRPMIDASVSNVVKMMPNPDFPGFIIEQGKDGEKVFKEHPTILIDAPDYHIVWTQ